MQEIGGEHAHDRYEAEVRQLIRALRGYGVLTGERLREVAGGRNWSAGTFDGALGSAVRSRRIRRLGDELYELGERSSEADA